MTYLVFTRTEYAQPLEYLETIEAEPGQVSLADIPRGDEGWLEVMLVPETAMTWVLRDADLVVAAEVAESEEVGA